jgi:hypothetical protein
VKQIATRFAALLVILWSATLVALEVRPVLQHVRTGDLNGDGRADLWRHFDVQGQLTEIDRDTNFDGAPDVEEYYRRGVLIRRESDRNFNGQTDLVEEFDPDTSAEARSVVDVDYDGTADLLVLFRDGRSVFSKQLDGRKKRPDTLNPHHVDNREREAGHLAALTDPFESDTCVRKTSVELGDEGCVGLSTSGGLPSPRFVAAGRPPVSTTLVDVPEHLDALAVRLPHSPRAPPIS